MRMLSHKDVLCDSHIGEAGAGCQLKWKFIVFCPDMFLFTSLVFWKKNPIACHDNAFELDFRGSNRN